MSPRAHLRPRPTAILLGLNRKSKLAAGSRLRGDSDGKLGRWDAPVPSGLGGDLRGFTHLQPPPAWASVPCSGAARRAQTRLKCCLPTGPAAPPVPCAGETQNLLSSYIWEWPVTLHVPMEERAEKTSEISVRLSVLAPAPRSRQSVGESLTTHSPVSLCVRGTIAAVCVSLPVVARRSEAMCEDALQAVKG